MHRDPSLSSPFFSTDQLAEAELKTRLLRRVDRLLAPGSTTEPSAQDVDFAPDVRDAIAEVAQSFNHAGWSAYLVGGTLRDLLVARDGESDVQPRDVDIMVQGPTRAQLQQHLEKFLRLERLTRFGGFHLSKSLPSHSRIFFDIWNLADNWGFQSKNIPPKIQDFPQTTFLNIDSCATDLHVQQGSERALFEHAFFQGIAHRALDINYVPNPYPYICVVRSLLIAAQLDFTLSNQLAGYIRDHTAAGGMQALMEAQQSHYGAIRCDATELARWIHDIKLQLHDGKPAIRIHLTEERRLHLRPLHFDS